MRPDPMSDGRLREESVSVLISHNSGFSTWQTNHFNLVEKPPNAGSTFSVATKDETRARPNVPQWGTIRERHTKLFLYPCQQRDRGATPLKESGLGRQKILCLQ
jgi:hypothetical protein